MLQSTWYYYCSTGLTIEFDSETSYHGKKLKGSTNWIFLVNTSNLLGETVKNTDQLSRMQDAPLNFSESFLEQFPVSQKS